MVTNGGLRRQSVIRRPSHFSSSSDMYCTSSGQVYILNLSVEFRALWCFRSRDMEKIFSSFSRLVVSTVRCIMSQIEAHRCLKLESANSRKANACLTRTALDVLITDGVEWLYRHQTIWGSLLGPNPFFIPTFLLFWPLSNLVCTRRSSIPCEGRLTPYPLHTPI